MANLLMPRVLPGVTGWQRENFPDRLAPALESALVLWWVVGGGDLATTIEATLVATSLATSLKCRQRLAERLAQRHLGEPGTIDFPRDCFQKLSKKNVSGLRADFHGERQQVCVQIFTENETRLSESVQKPLRARGKLFL